MVIAEVGSTAGAYCFMISNISNNVLSDNQVVRAIRPPLWQTLASSPAAASGRLANMTPNGHHRVELAVFEWKALGVSEVVSDRQAFRIRSGSSRVQQRAGNVDADHIAATPRDDPRGPAGSSRKIQNAFSWLGFSRNTQCSMASAMPRLIWSYSFPPALQTAAGRWLCCWMASVVVLSSWPLSFGQSDVGYE